MRHIRFCWNASSWDSENDTGLPGSMADLITRPILDHLPAGTWSIGRNPVEGAVNCYSSARSAFPDAVWPEDEISVLISHGIADKGIRQKLAPDFDYVVTPGPMHTDVLHKAGVPENKIIELGYTKLDPLYNNPTGGTVGAAPTVLYAPTQGGGGDIAHMGDTTPPPIGAARRSSWWRRDEVLALLDTTTHHVVQCHHPRYTPGHKATLSQYVGADAVIADGGSTLWEAIALSIPVVTPRWIVGQGFRTKDTLEARLYRTNTARHAKRSTQLVPLIDEAINDGPTDAEHKLSHRVLPVEYRGTSGQRHAEWLLGLAGG